MKDKKNMIMRLVRPLFDDLLVSNVRRSLICLAVFVVLLSGCAHSRPMRLQARDDFAKQDFAGAENKLASAEVLSENKSRLLTLLDLGAVAHAAGAYEKSTIYFLKARDLADQLYTKSVSEGVASWVTNDNSGTYAGFDYELSLLHYYLVLNNLMIAQSGKVDEWSMPEFKSGGQIIFEARTVQARQLSNKEIVEYYGRARSEVLAWDSFLEKVRARNRGKPIYKDDVVAKLLGAYVHRIIGTGEDLNTAKILYKDAQSLLLKSYGIFSVFNKKSDEFRSKYSQLPEMSIENVRANYINPTEHYAQLDKFITNELASTKAGDKQGGTKANNTLLILESGMIPEKQEKVFTIGLSTLFSSIEDRRTRMLVEEIGVRVLLDFAPKIGIGLVAAVVAGAATSNNSHQPQTITEAADKVVGFEFKVPAIPYVATDINYQLILKNASTGELLQIPLVVIDPIGDFATDEVSQKAAAVAAKTAIRAGLKYVAALLAAYTTYQKVFQSSKAEFLAMLAATAAWIGGKKLAEASESADTRQWELLPQTIAMATANIPPGTYKITGLGTRGSSQWIYDLGTFVSTSAKNVLLRRVY